jgi:hypothetical protein
LVKQAMGTDETPITTIETLLGDTAALLGLTAPLIRDVDLGPVADLMGQERLFAICAALGANAYINAPGGKHLYYPAQFVRRGIKLEFLSEYRGDPASILQRLHDADPADIRAEIRANLG